MRQILPYPPFFHCNSGCTSLGQDLALNLSFTSLQKQHEGAEGLNDTYLMVPTCSFKNCH